MIGEEEVNEEKKVFSSKMSLTCESNLKKSAKEREEKEICQKLPTPAAVKGES